MQFSSVLHTKNVHLQALKMSNVDVSQLMVVEAKTSTWRLKVMCLYVEDFLLSMMDYMWGW